MATYGQFVEFGPYLDGGSLMTLKIYHYEPGTTTLKNVWTDREKTTTAAQPLESDADGIASCYADGLYKFRIDGSTDGSTFTTLYTYDKVSRVDQTTSTGEGAALTSATTLTLGTDGDQFHVTGSTGPIGALSGTQTEVTLIFDSTPTLTHSGNLILQNTESYTAAAGDVLTFMNEGSGVWRETSRRLASLPVTDFQHTVQSLPQEFRLTLTTGTPVTTGDVTAAETLYCTPYVGNRIALYDGTRWNIRTSAEMSIDIPDVTGVHDVFCYDNSGVPTLEVLVWTNDTTRATALTYQNGILVKTGATTRRYLGSFYSTTAGNGQTEDSFAKRYVWNYNNRVVRPMRVTDATDSWSYGTATIRQANASTANQIEVVIGYSEDRVRAQVQAAATNTAAGAAFKVGIGVDSTTAFTSGILTTPSFSPVANYIVTLSAIYSGFPGVGRHYFAWLELPDSANTTWYGDNGAPASFQSGIIGEVSG